MKKVITVIIVMVMMVLVTSVAMADNYNAVLEYLDSMGIREKYEYGKYDEETGVFYYTGTIDMHGLTEECNIEENWDEKDTWFASWYENALKERYDIEAILEDIPTLEAIAKRRGLLTSGEYDISRAEVTLLKDFKDGKLGRISLDQKLC